MEEVRGGNLLIRPQNESTQGKHYAENTQSRLSSDYTAQHCLSLWHSLSLSNMSRQKVAVGSSVPTSFSPSVPSKALNLSTVRRSAVSRSTPVDREADELGLNSLELEGLFSRDSRSLSPSQNLSHSSPLQAEPSPDHEKSQPAFQTPPPRLISFADGFESKGKTTSLPTSTSNIGHTQTLESQLEQAKGTIVALKAEIQELRWNLETERVEEDKRKAGGVDLDMTRGQLVETEREREKLRLENDRLRAVLSGIMREKTQWIGLVEENAQLKRELADFKADFPVNESIQALKAALKDSKRQICE